MAAMSSGMKILQSIQRFILTPNKVFKLSSYNFSSECRFVGDHKGKEKDFVTYTGLSNSVSISKGIHISSNSETEKSDLSQKLCSTQKNFDPGNFITFSDKSVEHEIIGNMTVYEDFISVAEEESLIKEIDPYIRRLRYEHAHWDDAIHGYRETERRQWNDENKAILQRVQDLAFPPDVAKLAYVHILDLEKTGYIKPHIDAVRFCGNIIAGLSLLSSSVMRLVHDNDKAKWADIHLKQRSLYVMKDTVRYDYTHEILDGDKSEFKGVHVQRDRRISVIMRNEPDVKQKEKFKN